jgi:hypothetical protein
MCMHSAVTCLKSSGPTEASDIFGSDLCFAAGKPRQLHIELAPLHIQA